MTQEKILKLLFENDIIATISGRKQCYSRKLNIPDPMTQQVQPKKEIIGTFWTLEGISHYYLSPK